MTHLARPALLLPLTLSAVVACSSDDGAADGAAAGGSTGTGASSSGANGSGASGSGADGSGADGPGANGGTGTGANGTGATGTGATGADANGTGATGGTGGAPAIPGFEACGTRGTIASMGALPATTSRLGPDSHGSNYGTVAAVVPTVRGDGSFDIAWLPEGDDSRFVVSHIIPEGTGYRATWHVTGASLGQVGGLAVAPNDDLVVVTQSAERIADDTMPNGVHRDDIVELVRINESCEEAYRVDLRTDFDGNSGRTPFYSPQTGGTSRLAIGDGKFLLQFAANTEYDGKVDSRHQYEWYAFGDLATGALEKVFNGISHSFDQRLIHGSDGFVSLAMGDASLRGIGISHVSSTGERKRRTLFAAKGGDSATGGGYNNSFTRLGSIREGAEGYVVVFVGEPGNDTPERVSAARNVYLAHVPTGFQSGSDAEKYAVSVTDTASKNASVQSWDVTIKDYWGDTFDGSNTGLVDLTGYTDKANENAERAKIVPVAGGHFVVLWEKWSMNSYQETFGTVVDEYGDVVVATASLGTSARLPRGDDAFPLNGEAAFIESRDGRLVLHLVSSTLDAREVLVD